MPLHITYRQIPSTAALALIILLSGCAGSSFLKDDTFQYDYEIVNSYPHDTDAFTQGLIFLDGYLYESTGRYGRSSLRKVKLETGEVLQKHDLDEEYFAEGLTVWEDQLIQITLNAETGFIYDRQRFELFGEFTFNGNGWGLTNDGEKLVMSDGSPDLRYFDPVTFEETGRLTVTENGEPVKNINELQMVGDRIFANILFSEQVIIIDPRSGDVIARIDLEGLLAPEARRAANVLNGIAYDSDNNRLFFTGKLWPELFEIRLLPPSE